MCVLCVAIPFVLVTIAPRFITAADVNLFFLLEVCPEEFWDLVVEFWVLQKILLSILILPRV